MRIKCLFVLCLLFASVPLLSDTALANEHVLSTSESQEGIQYYNAAYDDEEPVRGFVRFYLRGMAGVVWIIVEWIAAILLYRGYTMLRSNFAGDGRAS